MTEMLKLGLYENNLSGTLPAAWANMTEMQVLLGDCGDTGREASDSSQSVPGEALLRSRYGVFKGSEKAMSLPA